MTYFLVSRGQKLALQASSSLDVRQQVWYLDERYLGRHAAGQRLFVPLQAGNHTLTCLDDKGRASSVQFNVKSVQ